MPVSLPGLSAVDVDQLRAAHYNAEVTDFRRVHDDLAIVRVRPDWGRLDYAAGQYTVLGLGNWEPRVAGVQDETLQPNRLRQLVKLAYSVSCSMLDSAGRIVRPQEDAELEFYITLVRQATQHAPALTPRLFSLARGDRLFVGPHAHGHYTLAGVGPHDNVVLAATGTGEAPHNAMVAQLLATGHQGQIVSMNCVRLQHDLAYLATHRTLERMFPNYRYIGLTTREPCNLDSTRPDYIGKMYLQDYFAGSRFEETCGFRLDPSRTQVFLCGNPAMIGAPQHSHALRFYPQPKGMVEILEGRGFRSDEPHRPGNLHFEKYW